MLLYGRLNHAVTVGAWATVKPSVAHHTTQGWEPQATDISNEHKYILRGGRQHQAPSYNEHFNITASFEQREDTLFP